MHIPYIAKHVLERNKNGAKEPWNLKGLLIGNGWTSPTDQYLSYLPFAYKMGLIQGGSDGAKQVESQQAVCVKALDQGGKDHVETNVCEDILQEILRVSQKKENGQSRCVNMYDVRKTDTYPSCGMNWPPDLENVTPYLRRADVVSALHVDADKKTGWTECNGAVGSQFKARNSAPAVKLLPDLLAQVPVMLFSGDQDMICNHLGTEELINNLSFNGGKGFELSPGTWAPRRAWTFEDEPAGIWQEARNLTYVVFYNSSHMVPFDYPRRTRDMLDRFMGVDIASIGGKPTDSRIDGEKGPQTSVGGHPNSTIAEEEEAKKLKEATWRAYYKSGEVALVVVLLLAGVGGWYVWRDRRRRQGYKTLFGNESSSVGLGNPAFKRNGRNMDVEAAEFDENELDDLGEDSDDDRQRKERERDAEMARERYSLGGESDEDEPPKKGANGHSKT